MKTSNEYILIKGKAENLHYIAKKTKIHNEYVVIETLFLDKLNADYFFQNYLNQN